MNNYPDKISDLKNSCTLIAVKEVTRAEDTRIIEAFKNHGYRPNKGMMHDAWTAAAKDLGMELQDVPTRMGMSYNFITLAQFIRLYKKGTYFVSVNRHALVVRDGQVVDCNSSPRLRRRVRRAKLVVNAPKVDAPIKPITQPTTTRVITESTPIKVLKLPAEAKRMGTESYHRYFCMYTYVASHADATIGDIMRHTNYSKADLLHDYKKGFISLS